MKTMKHGLTAIVLMGSAFALTACADGHSGRSSSLSVSASSYDDGYYRRGYRNGFRDQDWDGVPNRYDRDRDGDGVPNRYDARPANPNWP
jgi:hypothetical protein